jgi:lipopolysaccharide transport system ATP-binding protein
MSSSNWSIKAEHISKAYQLGEIGTGTLSRDIERWWAKIRGKQDPFLRIGETNDRTKKGSSDIVWSLHDLSFEIEEGDAVGVIGRNGAGKSTLLKILSKITAPTSGRAIVRGRVASLLEVGTGFHPELTGRENIFLNGAILGMRKHEIAKNFDAIVDFAGVERYIDTPVKRYSSGMYVRLAFAVAAHLESEVLVVDEVLAVGDAEFQRKCLGKMGEVTKGEGRTVLFVSHNMASIKTLCNKGILLQNGANIFSGSAIDTVIAYQKTGNLNDYYKHDGEIQKALGNNNIRIREFYIKPLTGDFLSLSSGLEYVLIFYSALSDINLDVTFELSTIDDVIVFHNGVLISTAYDSERGYYQVRGEIAPLLLNSGTYKFKIIFGQDQRTPLFVIDQIVQFEIMNEVKGSNPWQAPGITYMPCKYSFKKLIDDKTH